jgi:hypothetical protein
MSPLAFKPKLVAVMPKLVAFKPKLVAFKPKLVAFKPKLLLVVLTIMPKLRMRCQWFKPIVMNGRTRDSELMTAIQVKKLPTHFAPMILFLLFFFTTRRWMNWFFYSDASASLSSERNSIRSTRSEDEFRRELAPFLTYHYRLLSGRGNRGELVIDSTNFVQLEESAVLSFDRFVELCEIDNETAASIRGAEANMFNIHSLSAIVQKSEDDLQNHINTRLGIVQGIDTHARTQFDVPLFTLPTGSGNEIHIAHSHSEEPDCVATRFRGCFEVKSQSTKVCTSIKPAAVINHQF